MSFYGKYRGALHSKCNLRLKRRFNVPVFFHNLSGYDSHLFVKRLADLEGDVNCIPRNEEKYIVFNNQVLVDTIVKRNGKKNGKKEEKEEKEEGEGKEKVFVNLLFKTR